MRSTLGKVGECGGKVLFPILVGFAGKPRDYSRSSVMLKKSNRPTRLRSGCHRPAVWLNLFAAGVPAVDAFFFVDPLAIEPDRSQTGPRIKEQPASTRSLFTWATAWYRSPGRYRAGD